MISYDEVLARLRESADEKYRIFHARLLADPSVRLIGVRMPALRRLAREWEGEADELLRLPEEYYEVTFLKCAVVALLPYPAFCERADACVALLDNWAVCDAFHPRCIAAHREEFLPRLKRYFEDEREFVRRFALVTLLQSYMQEEWLPLIFDCASQCGGTPYYVAAAAGWLIAEVLARFYDDGLEFLQKGNLPKDIFLIAVKKARESFRLTPSQKEELAALSRQKYGGTERSRRKT